MNYKLVIFDFDGTLADSFPYFLSTLNTLAVAHKFKQIDPEDVDRLRGLDVRQLMNHVQMPTWKIPFIAKEFMTLMSRDIGQIKLFEGIPALLKQLSAQGVQLAIVSSNSEKNIRQVLGPEYASLITYYGGGTALFGKQSKFKKAMAKSGVSASETICIGDEIRDLEAAIGVKALFGGVTWGYARADVFEADKRIKLFTTVNEIAQTVLGESLIISS